jgi:hypothetical protein
MKEDDVSKAVCLPLSCSDAVMFEVGSQVRFAAEFEIVIEATPTV